MQANINFDILLKYYHQTLALWHRVQYFIAIILLKNIANILIFSG
jgi:hypothetical protein